MGSISLLGLGDEEIIAGLQKRIDSFNIDAWKRQQEVHPGRAIRQKNVNVDMAHLHNPYAGVHYAWQLTESLEDFLVRLPPRTTPQTEHTPWIFICNPYIVRVNKSQATNQASKGNEDEAPEEFGSCTNVMVEGAMERLGLIQNFTEGMRRNNIAPAMQERELQQERQQAAWDILQLAHHYKVRAGKVRNLPQPNYRNLLTATVDAFLSTR